MTADRVVAGLAGRQHGVVARRQLRAEGLHESAIDRRVSAGRLHRVHPGVYAVGHAALSRTGRWMAAVLGGGEGAVLSHRSAAEIRRLLSVAGGPIHVTVASWRPATAGIRWHTSALPPDEVTVCEGIPVTTVARTLLDIAHEVGRRGLENALKEAEVRRYTDALSLPGLVDRYPGRRGVATVRSIMAETGGEGRRTRSPLEVRFLNLLERHGVSLPATNAHVFIDGVFYEVDCLWRERRLIVELDGRAVHGTATSFESDRARDRALAVAGYMVIRVTDRQLRNESLRVLRDIRSLVSR